MAFIPRFTKVHVEQGQVHVYTPHTLALHFLGDNNFFFSSDSYSQELKGVIPLEE